MANKPKPRRINQCQNKPRGTRPRNTNYVTKKPSYLDFSTQPLDVFQMTDAQFYLYLAGLMEADGSIGSGMGITFDLGDYEQAQAICERLGLEPRQCLSDRRLQEKRPQNCWDLTFNKPQLIEVINKLNGYFVGPFKLNDIKKQWGFPDFLTLPLQKPREVMPNGFWFSGFFDGDGSIGLDVSMRSRPITKTNPTGKGPYANGRISLGQRDPYLMDLITGFFGLRACTFRKRKLVNPKTGNPYQTTAYEIDARSQKDFSKLLAHFRQYPLQSKKRAQLELVSRGFQMVCKGTHLTKDGQLTIKKLQKLKSQLVIHDYQNQVYQVIPEKVSLEEQRG